MTTQPIPTSMPEVTLGCFEDRDQATALLSKIQDVLEEFGTEAELYIAETKQGSWLVYMTTYELDESYVKKVVKKVEAA